MASHLTRYILGEQFARDASKAVKNAVEEANRDGLPRAYTPSQEALPVTGHKRVVAMPITTVRTASVKRKKLKVA